MAFLSALLHGLSSTITVDQGEKYLDFSGRAEAGVRLRSVFSLWHSPQGDSTSDVSAGFLHCKFCIKQECQSVNNTSACHSHGNQKVAWSQHWPRAVSSAVECKQIYLWRYLPLARRAFFSTLVSVHSFMHTNSFLCPERENSSLVSILFYSFLLFQMNIALFYALEDLNIAQYLSFCQKHLVNEI